MIVLLYVRRNLLINNYELIEDHREGEKVNNTGKHASWTTENSSQ